MNRKKSNSLLGAFKPPSRVSAIPLPGPSHPPSSYTSPPPSSHDFDDYTESASSHTTDMHGAYSTRDRSVSTSQSQYGSIGHASGRQMGVPSRSVSSGSYSHDREREKSGGKAGVVGIRRPEDVFRIVKERVFGWSYMMQWYQGDVHWFNTVRISRSIVESSIGPAKLESRARQSFVLGASLAGLFDVSSAPDYLRALNKLLDDWEAWTEGSAPKGVKGLFRGQSKRKSERGGVTDYATGLDAESHLLLINLPFSPDFYQVHLSTCSIIRDVYKKLLNMLLPAPSIHQRSPRPLSSSSMYHPSTIIQSATASQLDPLRESLDDDVVGELPRRSSHDGSLLPVQPIFDSGTSMSGVQDDAFQALVAGELPSDRMLVGDGQKLTPQVIESFQKADTKLRKHFSTLVREADTLARKVLDDELALLMGSLVPGSPPLQFDVSAALSGSGDGWAMTGKTSPVPPTPNSFGSDSLRGMNGYGVSHELHGWEEEEEVAAA